MIRSTRVLGIAALAAFTAFGADAQQIYGTPGSASATMSLSGAQLPPPDMKFGGTIKEGALQSKYWW